MDLSKTNIDAVRQQIRYKKNYNKPYYATRYDTASSITDMDNFPYRRFFRGEYNVDKPVVFEREAGYQPIKEMCYQNQGPAYLEKHRFCWQYPCSTIFPCTASKDEQKINDKIKFYFSNR